MKIGFIKDIDNDLNQLKRFDNNIEQDIQHIVKLCKIIESTHKNVEIKYDFCHHFKIKLCHNSSVLQVLKKTLISSVFSALKSQNT